MSTNFSKVTTPALLCFIGLLVGQLSFAGGDFCESQDSGNWSDPAIWNNCSGGIPIDFTYVNIMPGDVELRLDPHDVNAS
ncbi:hypothetical protein [Marinicella sp. W31]|uniref:hypothetical protein n=1 Tax=Marinicella sp. W31 TaxID=3023713 RepID=UPI003757CE2B